MVKLAAPRRDFFARKKDSLKVQKEANTLTAIPAHLSLRLLHTGLGDYRDCTVLHFRLCLGAVLSHQYQGEVSLAMQDAAMALYSMEARVKHNGADWLFFPIEVREIAFGLDLIDEMERRASGDVLLTAYLEMAARSKQLSKVGLPDDFHMSF